MLENRYSFYCDCFYYFCGSKRTMGWLHEFPNLDVMGLKTKTSQGPQETRLASFWMWLGYSPLVPLPECLIGPPPNDSP